MRISPGGHLQAGQALGHYQLIHPLDQRKPVEIWLGQHIQLQTPVALKILQLDNLGEEDTQRYERRLQNEARILASLHHQYIVGYRDYKLARRFLYIVMQYAPCGSVVRYHPGGRKLPLALIRCYAWQIGHALYALHRQRLIHRDVKPGNILLLNSRHALLADFGLAMRDPAFSYQQRLHTGGTTAYMAPEQYRGYPGPASDQYSLATCVYEWLTGHRPFYGETVHMMRRREHFDPSPVNKFRPELPPALEEIMQTALHRDPGKRYPTILEFVRHLVEVLRGARPSPTRRSASSQEEPSFDTADLEEERSFPMKPLPGTSSYRPPEIAMLLATLCT